MGQSSSFPHPNSGAGPRPSPREAGSSSSPALAAPTHTDTDTLRYSHPECRAALLCPQQPKAGLRVRGSTNQHTKEHTNTFPSSSKAPPIRAFSDSRSIRYWRDLANWLHLSFPRVKIGTEGGWCWLFSLALHFTYARHKRCHYNTGERL